MKNSAKPNGWALRKPSLDLGLDVLRACLKPRQRVSLGDIADVCQVSKAAIWKIEQTALRKVRRRLQLDLQQTAYDFSQNTTR